jgi:hypothetical protein
MRIRRMGFPAVALLLFAGAIVPASGEDEKLDLRLRLKAGESYRLRTMIEQQITQTAGANRQETQQTFAVGYAMTVESVGSSGEMKLSTRYDSILFRQKGPSGVVEYDSANPPKQVPPAARAFAALLGLGFKMTLTPEGRVTSIEGVAAMFEEMVRRQELPEGPAKAAVQKVLAEQFGEDAMKQSLQNMFSLYPEAPVAAGDTWQRRVVVSKGFPIVIEGNYTLKERTGGVARIDIKAAISPNDAAGPVDLGTGKMDYDLRGEQHGTAEIEEDTGWTRALTTEQKLSGTLRFQGGGGAPEVNNPVTIKEKLTMEPVK